jgi:HJR/Mrr/RecB family endonuclease
MGEIEPSAFSHLFEGESLSTEFSWEDVDRLNPLQFERWIASGFTKAGFSVKKPRATSDYVVDLVVRNTPQSEVVALIQVKHKLHSKDSLQLNHDYYEKIRVQSSAYKAQSARFALVSNATTVSAAQRKSASEHQIEIFLREKLDDLIMSLS